MSGELQPLTLARHYLEMSRPGEALKALGRAGSDQFELDEFWELKSRALGRLDRHAEAGRAAREGLSRNPDSVDLLFLLCESEARQGNLAVAEDAILRALRLAPDHPDLICRYAMLVARDAQFEKAVRLLDEAARIDPDSGYLARCRARLSYLRGRDAEAIAQSRRILSEDPEDPYAHALAGSALSARGEVLGASRHFRAAAELDPAEDDFTDAARESRVAAHWLLAPLWPLRRFGPVAVWIGAIATMVLLNVTGLRGFAGIFALVYIVFCLYSWVAPPVLGWWIRRRTP